MHLYPDTWLKKENKSSVVTFGFTNKPSVTHQSAMCGRKKKHENQPNSAKWINQLMDVASTNSKKLRKSQPPPSSTATFPQASKVRVASSMDALPWQENPGIRTHGKDMGNFVKEIDRLLDFCFLGISEI